MTLRGVTPEIVRDALATKDPFPGTNGFAGRVDNQLVRDVLGRELLYYDPSTDGHPLPDWGFTPDELDNPQLVPAGTVIDATGVDKRWTIPDPDPVSESEGYSTLKRALDHSLEEIDPSIPVAFSGGVDSGLLASCTDGPLYVCGFPESQDVEAATTAADALDRELRIVELTHDRLETAAATVARQIGRTNPMDVSIALPLFLTAQRVAADGYDRLLLGQGADELFGGYAKVAKAPSDPRTEAMTVRAARNETIQSLPDQLERDQRAVQSGGVSPVVPYLHDRVVMAAMQLPESLLVADGRRKVVLRQIGTDYQLPECITSRDKKALQYGSLVSRELDRLARQAGFKRRMDNHLGQYLQSLLDSTSSEQA